MRVSDRGKSQCPSVMDGIQAYARRESELTSARSPVTREIDQAAKEEKQMTESLNSGAASHGCALPPIAYREADKPSLSTRSLRGAVVEA